MLSYAEKIERLKRVEGELITATRNQIGLIPGALSLLGALLDLVKVLRSMVEEMPK